MSLLHIEGTKPLLQPDIIFSIAGFPITNGALLTWLIGLMFLVYGLLLRGKIKLVPGKLQIFSEMVVELIAGLIRGVSGSRAVTKRLLPIVGTLMLFIVVANSIGIIPGLSSITYKGLPLFRTPTNDFNMTVTLAISMSLLVHFGSIGSYGILGHIGKFIQIKEVVNGFRKSIGEGFMGLIAVFLGFMDIVSEFAKIISMSMRLFGNIYAGEVMTVVLYGLISVAIPIPWHAMSLFSGVIQALVFSMLTIVFYTLAVSISPEEEAQG